MKKLIILLLFIGIANASFLDVFKIKDAQEAYKKSDYNSTIINYNKVEKPSDDIHYNLGEAYYKDKKYKEALKEFKAVNSKKLEFKKQHNIGNTLAHLKKIEDAIKAYEKALKIKEDKDTRYNLELLKKMKKKQQQKKKQNKKQNKKNKKNDKQNKKNQNKKDGKRGQEKNKKNKNQQDKKNQDKKNKQSKNNQQNKNKQEKNKENQKKKNANGKDKKDTKKEKAKEKLSEAQKKKQEQAKKQKIGRNGKPKKLPISDMELRKYNKKLDKRGIKTLLLPINTKGAKHNEKNINPW